jgi:hypothetical protein
MSAPLRHGDLRGHRSAETLDAIARRNSLLVEAARRFCGGMSGREAARFLRTRLLRYECGTWRRSRVETQCPARHAGRIEAVLWAILKVRDHAPSERTVRAALSASSRE